MSKLTGKEKRLLIALVIVIVFALSYRFGYQSFHVKAVELKSENQEITNQLIELRQKETKKEKLLEEIKEYEKKANSILTQFPKELTQEKNIIFVTELEKYTDIKIDSITFQDMNVFYTGKSEKSTAVEKGENIEETEENVDNDSEVSRNITNQENELESNQIGFSSESKISHIENITGYETTMVLTYQSTYEGLKKAIDFINTYRDKRHISNITASYDVTTGNLSGTISISLYALNQGTDYVKPSLHSITVGKDNIFETFENDLNHE